MSFLKKNHSLFILKSTTQAFKWVVILSVYQSVNVFVGFIDLVTKFSV